MLTNERTRKVSTLRCVTVVRCGTAGSVRETEQGANVTLRKIVAIAAVVVGLSWGAPAGANDSSASLDTSGLRLTYNPKIRMQSEDLYLSPGQVRVSYRFENTGTDDVSTLVAFPLPSMEIGEEGNYLLHGKDPVNIIDFQVTVDGKRVDTSVEIKATRFGVDVTDVLNRHGIPLTMRGGQELNERLDNLPAEARRELERFGVIDWTTSFGAENKPLANAHWNTHIVFYWFQTFPAGRTIAVTHQYNPVPATFFFGKEQLTSSQLQRDYCMDASFTRGARAMLKKTTLSALSGQQLKYIVTTAGNWLGPIGQFSLTVEKPSASLVSLCTKGIKSSGPTSFTVTKKDFAPNEDIAILFVAPIDPDK